MMLSRLAQCAPRIANTMICTGAGRQFPAVAVRQLQPHAALLKSSCGNGSSGGIIVRTFQRDSRETLTRTQRIAERQTLRERAMAPVGPNGMIRFERTKKMQQLQKQQ